MSTNDFSVALFLLVVIGWALKAWCDWIVVERKQGRPDSAEAESIAADVLDASPPPELVRKHWTREEAEAEWLRRTFEPSAGIFRYPDEAELEAALADSESSDDDAALTSIDDAAPAPARRRPQGAPCASRSKWIRAFICRHPARGFRPPA